MESDRMATRGYFGLAAALRPDGDPVHVCPRCKEETDDPSAYSYFRLMPSGLCQRHDEEFNRHKQAEQKEDNGKFDRHKYLTNNKLLEHWKLITSLIKEAQPIDKKSVAEPNKDSRPV